MRLPDSAFVPGSLIGLKKVQCPECRCGVEFNIIHLITLTTDSEPLMALLFSREYYQIFCESCDTEFTGEWRPVIVAIDDMQVLLFATPGADDGGVEAGFHACLEPLLSWVDEAQRERWTSWPFVAVYGQQGLARMLAELGHTAMRWSTDAQGRNWRPSRPWERGDHGLSKIWSVPPDSPLTCAPMIVSFGQEEASISILHAVSSRTTVSSRDGHPYGKFMFYYPAQEHVGPAVRLFLKFSSFASSRDEKQLVYSEFSRAGMAELSHPWALNELARLAVDLGEDAADTLLAKSEASEFTRLSVTMAFVDATPRRRTADEVPSPDLATHEIKELGQHVTARRHIVTQVAPLTADYGFWSFPFSDMAAASREYSPAEIGRLQGSVIGLAERLTPKVLAFRGLGFYTALAMSEALPYLRHEEIEQEFWDSYLSFRYGDDLWRPDGANAIRARIEELARSAVHDELLFRQRLLRWMQH